MGRWPTGTCEGELAAELSSLMSQSADIVAAGATVVRTGRIRELDTDLVAAESRTARGMGSRGRTDGRGQGSLWESSWWRSRQFGRVR